MSQTLFESFMGLLVADQTSGSFYDDLGGRIYAENAPQNPTAPFCVVVMSNTPEGGYFGGRKEFVPRFMCSLYGDKLSGSAALAAINEKMLTLLRRVNTAASGFDRLNVVPISTDNRTVIEDRIVISSEWRGLATAA